MEDKNFASFMEFLCVLEAEDLKKTSTAEAFRKLMSLAEAELTPEQKASMDREFAFSASRS